MRDGVRLAISITRPSKEGKPIEGRFPVQSLPVLNSARDACDCGVVQRHFAYAGVREDKPNICRRFRIIALRLKPREEGISIQKDLGLSSARFPDAAECGRQHGDL
jgi:hypothetical protein